MSQGQNSLQENNVGIFQDPVKGLLSFTRRLVGPSRADIMYLA